MIERESVVFENRSRIVVGCTMLSGGCGIKSLKQTKNAEKERVGAGDGAHLLSIMAGRRYQHVNSKERETVSKRV